MPWFRFSWLAAAVLCAGCAAAPPGGLPGQHWQLVLERELVIPAGSARARFQDGRQVARVDRYRPHCELEIATVADAPQRLAPGVLSVYRRERRVVLDEDAALPAFGVASPFDCRRDHFFETLFWLESAGPPAVRRLLCRDWYLSCDSGRHLALDEMLEVLGPAFRLQ